jgi:hypothetical protein
MQRRDQCFDRAVPATRWSLKKKINGARLSMVRVDQCY